MRGAVAAAVLACGACRGEPTPVALDTTCPPAVASAGVLTAQLTIRGVPGPPETIKFDLEGAKMLVAWKNLLSGRALTLSCAYRPRGEAWALVRARVDEGVYGLTVSARANPPAVIYRDAAGRVIEELGLNDAR